MSGMMTQEASSPRRKKPFSPTFEAMEEDKAPIPGLSVRSVPMDRLASKCVDCFDEHGELVEDSAFPRVLFLMHKWFMTSEELAKQFKLLYPFEKRKRHNQTNNKAKNKNEHENMNMKKEHDQTCFHPFCSSSRS
ncbi:uncharacterized protein [Diadema antillarum]|uniref:uncharacterized protein n=1 Tax=Diadema antillarum TaxID=105358 RepID=UPI003A8C7541